VADWDDVGAWADWDAVGVVADWKDVGNDVGVLIDNTVVWDPCGCDSSSFNYIKTLLELQGIVFGELEHSAGLLAKHSFELGVRVLLPFRLDPRRGR
jgi:hypothetical protein